MIGLLPYAYKEGFVYHIIPFKPDPTLQDQYSKTNSLVMYANVMNKFKWGNYKHAKYLDQQSTQLFYPNIADTFNDLTLGLIKDGHADLALNALHKFDEVMPDINPNFAAVQGKISIADTSYKLKYNTLGDKLMNSVDAYITDQLDYSYYQLQNDTGEMNERNVQIGLSFLNGMASIAHDHNLLAMNNKLMAQLTGYENKFGSILRR